MSLSAAIGCGAAAALIVPTVARGRAEWADALLGGVPLRLPLAGGAVAYWSWTAFCAVTALCWGLFAAARQR